jgi:signal transduction histidine kinase
VSEAKITSSIPWLLLFGAGYFLTARLSHAVLFQSAPMGLVWAPNALLVSALVLAPRRSWWAVLAVAAAVHLMVMSSSTAVWRMVWQIAANAVVAVVTTEALRRFVGFPVRFERRRDVMVYTSLAVTMPAFLALIAPAFVMSLVGGETLFRPAIAFARVALANITPFLILTPAVLLAARFNPDLLRRVPRRRVGEAAVIIGAVLAVSGVAFDAGPELARFPWLLILTVPPLLWAAVRLGPTGASASLLCVAAISMWGATRQLGPFVVPADADVVLSLQIYWIMICLPVMLLAAAIREREVVEAALDDQRNQLARVTRIATAGELSGALAHELRQPMTAILANAQAGLLLLAREPADLPQIREILEDIASQDRQAGEVIARIRALLGGATSRREPVALESVVQDALSLTSQTAADANVRVQADVAAGLPPVRGDQVQLLQLLVNLVVNGCESMTDTAVTNRVLKLRVGRVGSDRLQVSVADSGVGLPVDAGDRVFEPFFTTKASGLGLGLSISRSVAAAHGGRLWGENNGGQDGATFHLELPADVRRDGRYYL